MRKPARIALWTLATVTALLFALWLYLRSADLSIYEDQIADFLSERIGHRLDVDGFFEFGLGRYSRLTAESITLANPEWPTQSQILAIGHLSVTFDTWSLLFGPLIIDELVLRDVAVFLERDIGLGANWVSASAPPALDVTEDTVLKIPVVRDVDVSAVRLVYLDPARPRPLEISIDSLVVDLSAADMLDHDLKGSVNGLPLRVEGELGPRLSLLDGQDITTNIELELGDVQLDLDGSVENLAKLQGIEAKLRLAGPSVERLAERFGLPPFADGAFRLDGLLQRSDSGNQLELEGNLGEIRILARGFIDKFLQPNKMALDFDTAGPDAKYIAEVFGIVGVPAETFRVFGRFERDNGRYVLRDTHAEMGVNALVVEGWLDTNAGALNGELTIDAGGPDFSVAGPFLGLEGLPAEAFAIDGFVSKSGSDWRFRDVEVLIGENQLQVSGAIGEAADTEIVFLMRGPDISILQDMTALKVLPAKPFEVSAQLKPDAAGIRIQDGRARVGDNLVDINGVVATKSGFIGTRLGIRGSGSELKNVALLAGVPYLPPGPFEFKGNIGLEQTGLLFEGFSASVGTLRATAEGSVGLDKNTEKFSLVITASGEDVADLAGLADLADQEWLQRLSGEPFSVTGGIKMRDDQVVFESLRTTISDVELDLDGKIMLDARESDLSFRIVAKDTLVPERLLSIGSLPRGPLFAAGGVVVRSGTLEFSNLELRLAENVVAADGTLSLSPLTNDSDLTFSAAGPDINELVSTFGIEGFASKPFNVTAHLTGTPTGFAARDFTAEIGDNNLEGIFTVNLSGKPSVIAQLSSHHLDIAREPEVLAAEQESKAGQTGGEYVFSDEPLKTQWLDAFNADLEISIERLVLNWGDVRDFRVDVKLVDGELAVDPVSFRDLRGGLEAQLRLSALQDDRLELIGSLTVSDLRPGVLPEGETDRSQLPAFNGVFDLRGTGRSLHEIMATSNGRLSVRQGRGKIRARSTFLFGDVVLSILRTINPLQGKSQHRRIDCGIYEVDIRDGVAHVKDIAVQSDVLTMVASGRVLFATEAIDLTVRSKPREGLGISIGSLANAFFKLGGTLKSPQVMIDTKSSATTTGAAVATGGLSIFAKGLWDRMSGAADICAKLDENPSNQASEER
jgi:uncharacterized protein involved in outer membrane biogenesis